MAANSFEKTYNGSVDKIWIDFYLGDMKARKRIIANNLNLIYLCIDNIAKNFKGAEKEDLFSIGAIALIKAVDGFDISKGYKFSTYAYTCIKNELCGYLRTKRNYETLTLFNNYEFAHSDDGISSLSYIGVLEDDINIEEDYEKKILVYDLYEAYSLLKDKYKDAIKLHFGLFGNKQHSVREISEILGISFVQARWLVEKGVLNLRKIFVSMGYDKKSMANSYEYRLKLPKY